MGAQKKNFYFFGAEKSNKCGIVNISFDAASNGTASMRAKKKIFKEQQGKCARKKNYGTAG